MSLNTNKRLTLLIIKDMQRASVLECFFFPIHLTKETAKDKQLCILLRVPNISHNFSRGWYILKISFLSHNSHFYKNFLHNLKLYPDSINPHTYNFQSFAKYLFGTRKLPGTVTEG